VAFAAQIVSLASSAAAQRQRSSSATHGCHGGNCSAWYSRGRAAGQSRPGRSLLTEDASGWHPRLEPAFAAAGLTHPAHGIPIGNPAAGARTQPAPRVPAP
jgi:hypothetical protein